MNLLVLPFVLFRLGANTFGVSLVVACTAPALAFSNALALSATRELAGRLDLGEHDNARRIFGAALFVAITGGGLIAITLSLAGPPLARWFFHLAANDDLNAAFLFSAGGWLCQCVAAAFTARQDYRPGRRVSLVSVIVSSGSILVLGPDMPPKWWFVGITHAIAASFIFITITAVSQSGPYRRTCWQDLFACHLLPQEAA